MLIHLDMLILALKPLDDDHAASSIANRIRERIKLFHMGQLQTLWEDAMAVSSRTTSDRPPTSKKDDKAAQNAADHDNWQTANACTCKPQTMVPIGNANIKTVRGLYTERYNPPHHPTPPTPQQNTQPPSTTSRATLPNLSAVVQEDPERG